LTFEARDSILNALDGVKCPLEATLPARQGSALAIQALAKFLDLALLLLFDVLGFERGTDQATTWQRHYAALSMIRSLMPPSSSACSVT
jgi:hypothetical protein